MREDTTKRLFTALTQNVIHKFGVTLVRHTSVSGEKCVAAALQQLLLSIRSILFVVLRHGNCLADDLHMSIGQQGDDIFLLINILNYIQSPIVGPIECGR